MSAPNSPKEAVSNDPHVVPTDSSDVNDSKVTEPNPNEDNMRLMEYSLSSSQVKYSEPINTTGDKNPLEETKESEIAAVGEEEKEKKDGEDGDEEEEEKEKPMVSAGELFQFADCFDKFLMIFGGTCAFINGAGMPAWSYAFGLMLNDLNRGADVEAAVTESAVIMVYIGLGVLVLSAIQVATWMVSSVRQMTRIRSAYFDALLRQDMAWHDEHKPGEVGARLAGDTKVIQQGINDKVANGLMNLGMGIFGFGFGFYESWKMTLVMLGTFPLVAGAGIAMAIILTDMTKLSRKGFATAGEISTEVLENIKTVQIFGTEARETARFATALGPAKAATKKKDFVESIGIGISYGIIFASYAAAFWFASYLIKEGEKDVGQVTSVFFAVLMGSFGMGLVFPSIASFAEARAAAFEVFAVINRKPLIDVKAGGKIIADLRGEIEFRNVKFSYPSRPDMKLFTGDFNCKIPAGTTAAFSGVSGCGKSSTVAMLLRYYDPQEGQILVDGVDLKELDVAWWRQNIGIVSQEPNLFSGTVADNIRLGRPDATPQEIKDACVAANINETIEGLPNGYETNVGQVGGQLSGGQKQRIAIARAIVKKPKILFLDEATSALDRKSEAEVQEALDGIMKGKDGQNLTVVVIAHRLTTIHSADQIHYLTYDAVVGSQLVESGTFTELVEKKGHFAVMADKLTKAGMGVASPSPNCAGDSTSHGTGTNASTRNQEVAVAGGAADDADGDGTPEKPLKPDEIAKWETDKTEVQTARIIALNEGYTWAIVIGMIGSLLSGGLYPAYAVILSKMLETLAKGAYDKQYLDDQTPIWAGLFIAVGFVAFLGWALQGFYGVAGAEMSEKLRRMLFEAILRQDMPFFDTPGREVGALGANLSGDCEAVHQLWGPSIGFKIQMACNLVVGLTISFVYSWKIALVVLAVIPLMIFTGAIQQMLLVGFGNTNDGDMTDDAVAAEALTNIRTVTSFNAGPEQVTRYSNLVLLAEAPQKRNGVVAGIAFGCSQFTFYGVFALAFWYGGTLIAAGEATFGDVLIASMALLMGAMGAGEAGGFAAKLEDADVAAKRVFAMIDRVPAIDGMALGGKREFDDNLEIELNKINFNYPARPDATVLTGLGTAFTGSNSYGLMGKTGCGKSTIMQLLARFYDPNQGEVLINGDNLNSFDLKSWRSHIAIVMQEPALFSGTIKENITYGVDGDHVTEDEIEMVASLAQIHEDILKMPEGYHTAVGYRGNQLSGGQKQRVAIARALLRRPKILLLDEATSALDNATEAAVQQGIATAVKEHPMMVVSIAHRLTTIRDSTKILLLEEGSILEEGSHDELVALEGEYKARWDLYTASSS